MGTFVPMNHPFPYSGPIGVFDSGYGGLTVLKEIRKLQPEYSYLYLGDNARAPYGPRSFEVVYKFTLQAVRYLFSQGCPLVILACNTASAKALRSIQQKDIPNIDPTRRVLGVIRPTAEYIGQVSKTGSVGILGTSGTVRSRSYDMEIEKLHTGFSVFSQSCPMFVPLVENEEYMNPGADYFVKKYVGALMKQSNDIDSIILGCTHYPLLYDKILSYVPKGIKVVRQGDIVARSLKDYLRRHPEIDDRCEKNGVTRFLTTENPKSFERLARIFMDSEVDAHHIDL